MQIKTAIILCAGFGKRLMPLTQNIPKPLIEINGITLLENTINLVKKLGIKSVKLNCFYLKNKIKEFINSKNFDLDIEIIDEGEKILNATAYVGCFTSENKISAMKTVETAFGQPKLAFDFVCYNDCKQRNSDMVCQQQCSLN